MNSSESKLIDWAWDDKIKLGIKSKPLHNYTESQVKKTMKKNLKFSSYVLWRKRISKKKKFSYKNPIIDL